MTISLGVLPVIYYNDLIKDVSIRLYKRINRLFTVIFSKCNITSGFSFDENKFASVWFVYDVNTYANRNFNITGSLWRVHNKPNIKYKPLEKSYEFYNYS